MKIENFYIDRHLKINYNYNMGINIKKQHSLIISCLFMFLFLLTGISYACYKFMVDLTTFQWIQIAAFSGIMVVSTAPDYRRMFIDLIVFYISSMIIISAIGVQLLTPVLVLLLIAFIFRVWKESKTDKKNFILLVLLVPFFYYFGLVGKSTFTVNCTSVCHCNMNRMINALDEYKTKNKKYPEKMEDLVPDYLSHIPRCEPIIGDSKVPFRGEIKERGKFRPADYSYEVNSQPDNYTIRCQGRNHEPWDIPKGYPCYNPETLMVDRPGENRR